MKPLNQFLLMSRCKIYQPHPMHPLIGQSAIQELNFSMFPYLLWHLNLSIRFLYTCSLFPTFARQHHKYMKNGFIHSYPLSRCHVQCIETRAPYPKPYPTALSMVSPGCFVCPHLNQSHYAAPIFHITPACSIRYTPHTILHIQAPVT